MSYRSLGQVRLAPVRTTYSGTPLASQQARLALTSGGVSSQHGSVTRGAAPLHPAAAYGRRFRGLGQTNMSMLASQNAATFASQNATVDVSSQIAGFSPNIRYILENAARFNPNQPGRFVGPVLTRALPLLPASDRVRHRSLLANEAIRVLGETNLVALGRKLVLLDAVRMSGALPLSYYLKLAAVALVREAEAAAAAQAPVPRETVLFTGNYRAPLLATSPNANDAAAAQAEKVRIASEQAAQAQAQIAAAENARLAAEQARAASEAELARMRAEAEARMRAEADGARTDRLVTVDETGPAALPDGIASRAGNANTGVPRWALLLGGAVVVGGIAYWVTRS